MNPGGRAAIRMTNPLPADARGDRARAPGPAIWAALFASTLLHALLIWGWQPRAQQWSSEHARSDAARSRLQVQLVPQAASRPPPAPTVPAPQAAARPPAPRKPPPALTAPRAPEKPPAVALARPEREPPPPAGAKPAPPAADLSSYVAARRRARGESADYDPTVPAPPAEGSGDPRDQIVAANLGLGRAPTFGDSPKAGGGVFQIRRVGYDDAEFLFRGWNREIRRNSLQVIEVRRGSNPSTEIAVVRRMIQIIRDSTDGDFLWISHRLGRELTLSARPEDTAGLESFLMQEFFGKPARQ
jgi:hypothetical protein